MKNTINFVGEYNKLSQIIFPTFRGASWYPVKSKHWLVTVEKKYYCFAYLRYQRLVKIKDIPLDLLAYDVAPYEISSRKEFIELLNTFRLYHKLTSIHDRLTFLLFENTEQKRLLDFFTKTDEEVIFD